MSSSTPEIDEDWEEWDGRSPFWAHCVAGSMAGVMEHAAIYPLDTVRTHIQVCASCLQQQRPVLSSKFGTSMNEQRLVRSSAATSTLHQQPRLPLGMWQTIRYLVSEPTAAAVVTADAALPRAVNNSNTTNSLTVAGWTRLFRGVQTILIGCIPAHALYFSSYEMVKHAFTDPNTGHVSTVGSSLAGAAAVSAHDLIMTPLDTLKQRLQIGHYNGSVRKAFQAVYQQEGAIALYRSFPITLLTNVPYGMVMVSTHEACKFALKDTDRPQWQIVLLASSLGGFTASAVTTPLDRIKTCLQTQQLVPLCAAGNPAPSFCPKAVAAAAGTAKHMNWQQAAESIWKEEGAAGFVRGFAPRVLSHTPAVAISWTTYETAKQYLLSHYH